HLSDSDCCRTWLFPTNMTKRAYQFNIIQRALFYNTLVALPTGCGKTFIAAVVMLNYYRWFPQSVVVFVAPTKPLVAQQVNACHEITGIPKRDMEELTGTTHATKREGLWARARVVFATPQTLNNDLRSGICDASRISLIVIDEAHHSLGGNANCEADALNPHVRILALTATPGPDLQTVQRVVDNLRIAKLELRTEESLDLREYMFERTIDKRVVELGGCLTPIRDTLAKVCRVPLQRIVQQGAHYQSDPLMCARFGLMQSRDNYRKMHSRDQIYSVEGDFAVVIPLVDAIQSLLTHGLKSCHTKLDELTKSINDGLRKTGKISRAKQELIQSDEFINMKKQLDILIGDERVSVHPKVGEMIDIITTHFKEYNNDVNTRVMVFASFREIVDELIRELRTHSAIIKPMAFVGQSSGKTGRGLTQKEQLKVLDQFKSGVFNVLVATNIGEEGLDIGEVDLIVCFDSQSSPIRMLQRMGRTGRKRQGRVVLLMTKGIEESKFNRSKSGYKNVQKAIATSKVVLHSKLSPRMLPPGIKPQLKEVLIE
ncbi:P-loop containing nucleoside triphosphate hydrolase protein, partial [Ramicandelaber brevisporus]